MFERHCSQRETWLGLHWVEAYFVAQAEMLGFFQGRKESSQFREEQQRIAIVSWTFSK